MPEIAVMTVEEFHAALRAQGVPRRRHVAFRCPVCGTVQSPESLIRAGAGATEEEVERYIAFSCVGRFTGAGPHKRGESPGRATPRRSPGRGCDWTLGGLFQLHRLEVVTPDGVHHPRFEPATAEEARVLLESWGGEEDA